MVCRSERCNNEMYSADAIRGKSGYGFKETYEELKGRVGYLKEHATSDPVAHVVLDDLISMIGYIEARLENGE